MIATTGIKKSRLGFTLVEVLVAVGVMVVGLLAFLPSFRGANEQKSLTQAVENAKDALATARNRALTETVNPGGTSPYVYSGVKFVAGSSSYTLFRSDKATPEVCNALSSEPSANVVVDSVKSLPGGVVARIPTLNPDEDPTCIFFEFGTGNSYTTKGASSRASCND